MKHALCLAVAALFVTVGSSSYLRAEDAPTAPAAPASQPTTAAATLIQATDKDALKAALNTEVTVEGVISSAEWSRTGAVMNIEFKDSDLLAVAFKRIKEKLDKSFNEDAAKTFTGAKVRLRGKLAPYGGKSERLKDHPQIIINDTPQITILEAGTGATSKPAE